MASIPVSSLRSRVTDRLSPHGRGGLRASLAGVVDLDALEENRYEDVLGSVEARLSTAQYSLVSMLVAGIYFGLLVGSWLMSTASWLLVARWAIPLFLITGYGVYASYQTIQEIRELSEARSLLRTLEDPPSPATPSGE